MQSLLGLRIEASSPTSASRDGRTIPYGFDALLEPMSSYISALYWAVEGDVVFSAAGRPDFPDDRAFTGFFQADPEAAVDDLRPVWEGAWLKPGGLQALAAFIEGDWTDIVGVSPDRRQRRSDVRILDPAWLEENAEVYFTCVDSAFWAVFSSNARLLDDLLRTFPRSRSLELRDRWW